MHFLVLVMAYAVVVIGCLDFNALRETADQNHGRETLEFISEGITNCK